MHGKSRNRIKARNYSNLPKLRDGGCDTICNCENTMDMLLCLARVEKNRTKIENVPFSEIVI